MKHKKENARKNAANATVKNNSVKKTKHFINKSYRTESKLKKYKLFSLQHQTLDTLKKAERMKKKEHSNKLLDVLLSKDDDSTVNQGGIGIKDSYKRKKLYKTAYEIATGISETRTDIPVFQKQKQSKKKLLLSELDLEKNDINRSKNISNYLTNGIESASYVDIESESKTSNKNYKKSKRNKFVKSDLQNNAINISKNISNNLTNEIESASAADIEWESETLHSINKKYKKQKKTKNNAINRSNNISNEIENVFDVDIELESETCNKKYKKPKWNMFVESDLKKNTINRSKNVSNNLTNEIESAVDIDIKSVHFNKKYKKPEMTVFVETDISKNKYDSDEIDETEVEEQTMYEWNKLKKKFVKFYVISGTQALLTLVHPYSLHFTGIIELEVLTGSVDVLGYVLDRFSGKHRLYSPEGSNYLTISSKHCGELDETVIALKKLGLAEHEINLIKHDFQDNISILLLNKDESEISSIIWPKFVEVYASTKLLPKTNFNTYEQLLKCRFHTRDLINYPRYCEMPEWKQIVNYAQTSGSRTILCGGKNVGKSTLLKYLVNKSLSKYKEILVLDFDVGQPEFTVSGCVSATVVKSPLLGPNFCHRLTPLKSLFVGENNVAQCIGSYFKCVDELINFCNSSQLKIMPWFVNTMGFNKGLGVLVMATLIKKISPTAVVQIQAMKLMKINYPAELLPDFVEANLLNLRNKTDSAVLDYRLFVIPSAIESLNIELKNCAITPRSLRNIMILSYFGQMLNSEVEDIYSVEPYVVNVSNLWIKVINNNLTGNALLDAINGSLVALCTSTDQHYNSINVCLGFGIVRAVNKETQQLFIITPLTEDKLCEVNSLVKGDISLPDHLFTIPPKTGKGLAPYVSYTNNTLSGTISKTFKTIANK